MCVTIFLTLKTVFLYVWTIARLGVRIKVLEENYKLIEKMCLVSINLKFKKNYLDQKIGIVTHKYYTRNKKAEDTSCHNISKRHPFSKKSS